MLLHLLAPNHRPQQVTEDLASFWKNGIRSCKELRARYPRHSWPEGSVDGEAVRGQAAVCSAGQPGGGQMATLPHTGMAI